MQYKLVPFDPNVAKGNPTNTTTAELKAVVDEHAADGWEYVELANHSTVVPGSNGCFGFGATQPYPKTMSIVVFKM